jgi:hypothetical protein
MMYLLEEIGLELYAVLNSLRLRPISDLVNVAMNL